MTFICHSTKETHFHKPIYLSNFHYLAKDIPCPRVPGVRRLGTGIQSNNAVEFRSKDWVLKIWAANQRFMTDLRESYCWSSFLRGHFQHIFPTNIRCHSPFVLVFPMFYWYSVSFLRVFLAFSLSFQQG